MEKQRVNDAVVNLGNLISKGRIFVVRRLSAKIRALRQKINQQCSDRITRWLLEIAYLKTLIKSGSRKLLARKILVNTDDHAAKLEQESTTPEERAFYRLCKIKFIEKFVTKFREENVDWEYWVPPLLAMWDKKVELKAERRLNNRTADQTNRVSVKNLSGFIKEKQLSDAAEVVESKSGIAQRSSDLIEALKGNRKRKQQAHRFSREGAEQKTEEFVSFDGEPGAHVSNSKDNRVDDRSLLLNEDPDDESDSVPKQRPLYKEASIRLMHFTRDGDSEATKESDAPEGKRELCHIPFRPYAPKYFVGGSESDGGDDDDDDDKCYDHDYDKAIDENCDDGQSGDTNENVDPDEQDDKYGGKAESDHDEESISEGADVNGGGLTVEQLETNSLSDEGDDDVEDSERDLDEDTGDETEQEREFEARIEENFKKAPQIQKSTYEPESSEEEFPNSENANEGEEDEIGKNNDCSVSSSFFLRKGERPQAVQTCTIPKERAPGLNRRQRRGHKGQRASVASAEDHSDDAEAYRRPSVTFGNDFRFRKSFQNQDRGKDYTRKHVYRNEMSILPKTRGNRDHFQSLRTSLPPKFHSFSWSNSTSESMNRSGDAKFQKRSSGSRFQGKDHAGSYSEGRRNESTRRFSERGEHFAAYESHRIPSNRRNQNVQGFYDRNRSSSSQADTVTKEKLHPSWSAKRKMAASYSQPFQGKKTVFDD